MTGPRVLLLAVMSNWMFQNLVPSLRRLCSRVYAYPFGNYMSNWDQPRWLSLRTRLVDRLLSDARVIAKGEGIDLVLMLQYDESIGPGTVRSLQGLGARVASYHVDMGLQWYRVLRQAPSLDLLAVSHMQNLEPFVRRGVPLHFMPMAASPDRYDQAPREDVPARGVLMLGRPSANRMLAVAACRSVADEVDVYGTGWPGIDGRPADARPGRAAVLPPRRTRLGKLAFDLAYVWPRLVQEGPGFLNRGQRDAVPDGVQALVQQATMRGYADDADVPSLMARAAITLGVNQRHGMIGDRRGVADSRLRDFEATLAGSFFLVQSYVDLPVFFRPGVEVETWSSLEELKRKVRYYLDHPDERRAIATAGRARARNDHTWDQRLEGLFARLDLVPRRDGAVCPLEIPANLSSRPWCGEAPGCAPTSGEAAEPMLDTIQSLKA